MESSDPADLTIKLAASALSLASATAWHEVSLSDLCTASGVTLVECAKASVTKAHVDAQLDANIDQLMLATASKIDRSQSVRDRLFDVLMGRFDAMEENRAAWVSILTADKRDMIASIARRARRTRTGAWALEAAGVNASDLRGAGQAIGLARILRRTDDIWLSDGPELAKTMARLDELLRKGEEWADRFGSVTGFFSAKPVVEPTL